MRILFIIFIITGMLSACSIDPNRKKKDREKLTEYLTKIQTDSLKSELDSLCETREEQAFDHLVDSVLQVRLETVKEKLRAYKKEE